MVDNIKSKPASMSVKAFLIRRLANKHDLPESTVEAVVNHCFKNVVEHLSSPECLSVEITGVGRLLLGYAHLARLVKKWREQDFVFYFREKEASLQGNEKEARRLRLNREDIHKKLELGLARMRLYESRHPDKSPFKKPRPFERHCRKWKFTLLDDSQE